MTRKTKHIQTLSETEYVELIRELRLARYADIPAIDLYMDQLLTYIDAQLRPLVAPDEKLLTASMVNNYVKQGIIPAPKAKRYTANHVAMLTVICLMKRTFSMNDIHSLLRVSAATHGIDHAYNFFCEAVEESLRQLFCGEIAHTSLGSCDIRKPDGPAFALQGSNAADLSPERRLALSAATSVANKIYVEKCFELGILDGADVAAAANQAAAKAWEKHRARILSRIAEKEIARDIVTLAGMTEIYCADHHAAADRTPYESEATAVGMYPQHKIPRLCPECAAHLRYGEVRRALCRREPRPACKTCKSHCYTPTESAWQRRAMAYAGPRAMFRGHAIEAIRHLIHTRKS